MREYIQNLRNLLSCKHTNKQEFYIAFDANTFDKSGTSQTRLTKNFSEIQNIYEFL